MRELEKVIIGRGRMKGHTLTQLQKGKQAYVYMVKDEFGHQWYEAFKRIEGKEVDLMINGVPIHYEAQVIYPGESLFGISAKCCNSLERAMHWYNKWEHGTDGRSAKVD